MNAGRSSTKIASCSTVMYVPDFWIQESLLVRAKEVYKQCRDLFREEEDVMCMYVYRVRSSAAFVVLESLPSKSLSVEVARNYMPF